jgi:flagellar biosynthesis protein FlhA
LNAGLISEDDARRRRELIAKEADFYGAMDGASKFVRGDAIAAVLITLINVIGGFIIGVAQMGMPLTDALKTYTLLSIGDGLVTQVPALIIATSAGIIVTRAASESNLGHDLSRQLGAHPKAILIAAVMLLVLGVVPGMPTMPFILLGGAASVIAFSQIKEKKQSIDEVPQAASTATASPEKVEDLLKVDILEVEIGYGLISLVDSSTGNDLLDRITLIRKQIASELGIIVPPIRIRDNVKLKPNQYQIKIKGIPLASSILYPDQYLAINPGTVRNPLAGLEVREPAFNLSAIWVDESQKALAEKKGYTVVECTAVLATHLTELIKTNASDLLTRQEVSKLVENVKVENTALIEELVPGQLGIGAIQHVLQNLLAERIPIKDLPTILEALADHAGSTKDTDILSEYARYSLARTITSMNMNDDESIKVITFDHQLEKLIADSVQNTKQGILAIIPPDVAQKIVNNISDATNESMAAGYSPVILTSPNIRLAIRRLIAPSLPRVTVISFNEIIPNLEIESILTVRMPDEN